MKIYIKAQSEKKKDIASRLDNQTYECMIAIAQLYLFPNYSKYHHHWAQEVWNHFQNISKVKKTNKYPTANFILNNTWYLNNNKVQTALDAAVYHESHLNYDADRYDDIDTAKDIMFAYFIWMSERLSHEGTITFREVQNELEYLNIY